MGTRTWVLIVIAVLLGGSYVYFFTSLFEREEIRIVYQLRPESVVQPTNGRRPRKLTAETQAGVFPVVFTLDKEYELTKLQVFIASELKANSDATPIWSLIQANPDKPVKVKGFRYGNVPRGMKSAEPEFKKAQTLGPDITYLLRAETTRLKGETEFRTKELAKD